MTGVQTCALPILLSGALSIAESINEKSQDAMTASKRLIRKPYLDSLKEQLNRESRSIAKLSETENAEIGMKAFIEKIGRASCRERV